MSTWAEHELALPLCVVTWASLCIVDLAGLQCVLVSPLLMGTTRKCNLDAILSLDCIYTQQSFELNASFNMVIYKHSQ